MRVTLNPAACRVDCASSKLLPTTSGTWTCGLPLETTSVTDEPLSTFWPSVGLTEITRPSSTVSEFSSRSEACSPTFCNRPRAEETVRPTTCGTATCWGPAETVSVTVEPFFAFVPPVGSWPMTWPAGCSAVFWTVSRWKPSWRSLASALAWSAPTTVGTATFCVPGSRSTAARPRAATSTASSHSHQRPPSRGSRGGSGSSG